MEIKRLENGMTLTHDPASKTQWKLEQRFASWGEFVNYVDTNEPEPLTVRGLATGRSSHDDSREKLSFTGTRDWKQAMEMARIGWKSGALDMKIALDNFKGTLPTRNLVKETKYAMVGPGVVNFDRYQQGHPMLWKTTKKRWEDDSENGKIVHIAFGASVSGAVDVSTIMKRGAVIVALVDLLEQAGKRVQLTIKTGTAEGGNLKYHSQCAITVKQPDQQIDLSTLAFAVAHPSSFRRLQFAWEELAPAWFREATRCYQLNGESQGYGYVTSFRLEDDNGVLNIPAINSKDYDTKASQLKFIEESLASQGVVWESE